MKLNQEVKLIKHPPVKIPKQNSNKLVSNPSMLQMIIGIQKSMMQIISENIYHIHENQYEK